VEEAGLECRECGERLYVQRVQETSA